MSWWNFHLCSAPSRHQTDLSLITSHDATVDKADSPSDLIEIQILISKCYDLMKNMTVLAVWAHILSII